MKLRLLAPAVALATIGGVAQPGAPADAEARLAVRTSDAWITFWRAGSAPARWASADAAVSGALRWHPAARGIDWSELLLAGSGEAWRTRLIVVRIDPAAVRMRLINGVAPGGSAATWSATDAPAAALVALNVGQFSGAAPWGWVVHEGKEYRQAGRGPLAEAVIIERDGSVSFANDVEVERRRRDGMPGHPADIAEAFQSYPVLLRGDGEVPALLSTSGPFIDLGHRDARLALGQLSDGALIVAMTRFDGLGERFGAMPFGLTIPEMSAVMGALGCRRALALDGGVSSQLLVRDSSGTVHAWRGLRRVPLGLVATR